MKPFYRDRVSRRQFVGGMLTAPVMSASATSPAYRERKRLPGALQAQSGVKLSLNAYSFNKPLLDGSMTLDDLLEFCAAQGLAGVDITGYYFKGYPQVPSDEIVYHVKRKAFSLGVEICGTGVRNDFTHTDPRKRKENVQLVKDWIEVAQKLGGQTLRIFSGTQKPPGYSRSQILEWMLEDFRECAAYGEAHGVVVALQNHDDFVKTAGHTVEIMESIKTPWFGLMLDIGSFRTDPYEEIARTIQYAVTWQIKEKVYLKGVETEVDADRLMGLILDSGFRGYLPLETLGSGDARKKVAALHEKFLEALARRR